MEALRVIDREVLGTNWYIEVWPVDGCSIWVIGPENETLYNKRVIADSLYEAVCLVANEVWAVEIEQYQDYELPARIANALGIEEPEYEDA